MTNRGTGLRATGSVAVMIAAALGLVACGEDLPTFQVGAQTLVVRDTGFVSTTERFADLETKCMGGRQVRVRLVDWTPICDLMPEGGPMGPGADVKEHVELQVIFSRDAVPDFLTGKPFDVKPTNCSISQGAPAVAKLLHYPAMALEPDVVVMAESGTLVVSAFDETSPKPMLGTYDLKFGATQVKGTLETLSCN